MPMRLATAGAAAHVVDDGRHLLDRAVQVDARGQEAGEIAALLVIGVEGDLVDEVGGLLEHEPLPLAEGGHRGARAAACDQPQRRVVLAHGASRLGRQPSVLRGRLVAQLPGSVKLVAEAPAADAEGLPARRVRCAAPRARCRAGWLAYSSRSRASATPRVPRFRVIRGSTPALPAQRMNSWRPKAFDSRLCQARSSRAGRRSGGPTPSSHRYPDAKLPPG